MDIPVCEIENDIVNKQLFALSCNTRRKILLITKESPLTVRDMAQRIELTQVTIKRHIKVLLECRLLIKFKIGNVYFYQSNKNENLMLVEKLSSLID